MDISQAAFGLDMRSASRIYFISPVLNPQVEAQAIGRARRISQQKPVSVETLVLKGSIEELMVERRKHMTQAEHRRVNSVLDDKPMYEWILNARIMPMDEGLEDGVAQTAMLKRPQFVFGRGFGREAHPDEDLVMSSSPTTKSTSRKEANTHGEGIGIFKLPFKIDRAPKRSHSPSPASSASASNAVGAQRGDGTGMEMGEKPRKKRARIAWADQME
jgi:hypothetical protein